jgi:hypothetical protein
MIIFNKFSGYSRDGIRKYYMGGGGGGPTTSTVNQSNIPEWLRPQVEQVLGGATKELFKTKEIPGVDGAPSTFDITGTKNYTPYSVNPADYVAGFSPLQQQVQENAANLQVPNQFNQGTRLAGATGMGALGSTNQAYGYGAMGLQAGQTGQQVGNQAQQYAAQAAGAGQNYANQATDPAAMQAYMSPYMQNVTDIQNEAAQRQADIASQQRGANAARSGAFGGARQAIENAEANRALQSIMNANQATGLQTAYQQAQQAQQYGAGLNLQGLQGAQQGLGTALQGGQLGLSGINTALQGVSGAQSGYGLANQAAGTLGSLGTQQLAGQTGILGLQNQIGGQQQAQEQAITNQAISNYAQAQNAPMDAMNQYNALLRGYALPGTTTTQYQAQPTLANQLTGFGTAAIGATALSNAMGKKKGGTVRSGIAGLGLANAMK